jgi:hypothetical protein
MAADREALAQTSGATEITLILMVVCVWAVEKWSEGEGIMVLAPGETTDFEALTDSVTVVVKVPGALDDNTRSKLVACDRI